MHHYDYEVTTTEPYDTIIVDVTPLTPPPTPTARRSTTRKSPTRILQSRMLDKKIRMANYETETEPDSAESDVEKKGTISKKRKRTSDTHEDGRLPSYSKRSREIEATKSAREKKTGRLSPISNEIRPGAKSPVKGHFKLGSNATPPPKIPPERKQRRKRAVARKASTVQTEPTDTNVANDNNGYDQASQIAPNPSRELGLRVITESPPPDTWYAGVPRKNCQWTICIKPAKPTWYHPDWDVARQREADEKTRKWVELGKRRITSEYGLPLHMINTTPVFWWQCHTYRGKQSWALNVSPNGYDEY